LDAERRRLRPHRLDDIVDRFAALPILDERSSDEIIGYDDDGIPA